MMKSIPDEGPTVKFSGSAVVDNSTKHRIAVVTMSPLSHSRHALELLRNKLPPWILGHCATFVATENENDIISEIEFYETSTIDDDRARALADALKQIPMIQKLTLTQTQIGVQEICLLAQGLVGNRSLEKLHISCVHVGNEGAAALANALVNNNSRLNKLVLRVANVGNEGASAVAKALETNTCLRDLDMAGNHVGNSGMEALGHALRHNPTLNELDMQWNDFNDDGAKMLLYGLRYNSSIQILDLSLNNIGLRRREEGNFYCKLNRSVERQFVRDIDIPWGLWPRILAKLKTKQFPKSQLFWFLREKPELFKAVDEGPHSDELCHAKNGSSMKCAHSE